jgi:hypothetical protein
MFEAVRRVKLDDGRTLRVQYQGEEYGWGAFVLGPSDIREGSTPREAIVNFLGLSGSEVPAWVQELSDDFERELREAPRFICECCGYRTLLSEGYYEICRVCGWQDDRNDLRGGDLDMKSGPNRMSLREAQANFRRDGTSDPRLREHVRDPRPDEFV